VSGAVLLVEGEIKDIHDPLSDDQSKPTTKQLFSKINHASKREAGGDHIKGMSIQEPASVTPTEKKCTNIGRE